MAKTPEGKVKDEIKAFLDSLGAECWYFMPMMMGYGRKGIPDFIGCYKGRFFSIEAKAPGKAANLTPWQAREKSAIMQASGIPLVCDSILTLSIAFAGYF